MRLNSSVYSRNIDMATNKFLVWMDLEMTGLEPERDVIIEIATIITDDNLNVVAQGPVLAVHQPDLLLDAMDDWNTRTHGESGLVERVRSEEHTSELQSRPQLVCRLLLE